MSTSAAWYGEKLDRRSSARGGAADPGPAPRLLRVEEPREAPGDRADVEDEPERRQRPQQEPGVGRARPPAILAKHQQPQRQDETHALEPCQHGQRQEDARPGAMAPLGREERRDHEQQEQPLRVGHPERRGERVDRQQPRRQGRPTPPQVGRPQRGQQREPGEERHVRDEHRHETRPAPATAADRTRTTSGKSGAKATSR